MPMPIEISDPVFALAVFFPFTDVSKITKENNLKFLSITAFKEQITFQHLLWGQGNSKTFY